MSAIFGGSNSSPAPASAPAYVPPPVPQDVPLRARRIGQTAEGGGLTDSENDILARGTPARRAASRALLG